MTDEQDLHRKYEFVQKSIDLLASGAAWGSGSFVIPAEGFAQSIRHNITETALASLAKNMLIDGVVTATGLIEGRQLEIEILDSGAESAEGAVSVNFQRQETSFQEPGISILHGLSDRLERADELLRAITYQTTVVTLLEQIMRSVHAALAIPGWLLDQASIDRAHPLSTMQALVLYRGEVQSLRSNIGFGLDRLAEELEGSSGKALGIWWWGSDIVPQGRIRNYCSYGPIYQVFLHNGIDLRPVREQELSAAKQLVDLGLLSHSTYQECLESYGSA